MTDVLILSVSACHLVCHMDGRGCHLQDNSWLYLKCMCKMPWHGTAVVQVKGSAVGLGWGLGKAGAGGRKRSQRGSSRG